jgi:hypothetical protein
LFENDAWYIQDSWDVSDRLNLNIGLRSSSFANNDANGDTFIDVSGQKAYRLGATYYLAYGGARPGLKEMLKLLSHYKDTGKVFKIVMYTSARNGLDWVNFLKDCLEGFAEVDGLFDLVLHRGNSPQNITREGSTVKDMKFMCNKLKVEYKDTRIIMFDDKPHNIRDAHITIGMKEYRHIIEPKYLKMLILNTLRGLENIYKNESGTYGPLLFYKNLETVILEGREEDVRDNKRIFKCPINQSDDTELVTKSFNAFLNIIEPTQLERSSSFTDIIIPSKNTLVRTKSG